MERTTAKGRHQRIDLKQCVMRLSIQGDELEMTLKNGDGPSVRPPDVLRSVLNLDRAALSRARIVKVGAEGPSTEKESMFRKLIVNMAEHETRVALLEDGTIVELFIHRQDEGDIAGKHLQGARAAGAARHAGRLCGHRAQPGGLHICR